MMRLKRRRPTVRNGEGAHYNIDNLTRTRIEHAIRFGESRLHMYLTGSSIVRRAVEFYSGYVDTLIDLPADSAQLIGEEHRLLVANQGNTARIPDKRLLALPLRKFSDLLPITSREFG